MCGIAGIVSLNGRPVSDAERRVSRMTYLLRHRGPDRQGIFVSDDSRIALGNTRLAIVDVETKFDVPMQTADGAAVLSFNGEIYNFADERHRLIAKGIAFRTRSDTEVLLEGLRLEGNEFLRRLDGFWGFAYFDSTTGQLKLSRDLLGERNVFYRIDGDELLFASEVNPILDVAATVPSLDFEAVACAFRFRSAPPSRTVLSGINRLLPGQNLLVDRNGNISSECYQRLQPERWFDFFAKDPTLDQVLDAYEAQLWQACRARVPREVFYMASLSGGLDSAVVNLFASDFGRKQVQSLYGQSTKEPPKRGQDLDELTASRFTSDRLGTKHHVFDMIADDAATAYREQCANGFDGLFCEGSIGFRQLAEQVADRHGRVLLLSDGPDELLGGYERDFNAYRLHHGLKAQPIRSQALRKLARLPIGRKLLTRLDASDVINWSFLSEKPFHFRPIHGGTSPDVMAALFSPDVAERTATQFGYIPDVYASLVPHLDLSQRMALSYAAVSLPDYFNLRVDRAVNWHSVESRVPLQSPDLVELLIATPARWRYANGTSTKFLFRKIVERHIGPEIANRQKYGFAMPAWQQPKLAKLMAFDETVAASSVFDEPPFNPGAKEFLQRPTQQRTRWFGYCLALTHEKLKSRDFATRAVPKGALQAVA